MKTPTHPQISSTVIEAGQVALNRVVAPLEGVHIALLCTPDGFEITALRVKSELPTERLSAMAGSLMAMAKAVAAEIGHKSCHRLTFETELGTVFSRPSAAATRPSCAWWSIKAPCWDVRCGPRAKWPAICPVSDPRIRFKSFLPRGAGAMSPSHRLPLLFERGGIWLRYMIL